MLDFARDKRLWEKIRTSDEFIQHRKEVKELYEKAFKTEPRFDEEFIIGTHQIGLHVDLIDAFLGRCGVGQSLHHAAFQQHAHILLAHGGNIQRFHRHIPGITGPGGIAVSMELIGKAAGKGLPEENAHRIWALCRICDS